MAWNNDVATEVSEALEWDPHIDSTDIGVSVDDGTVTLRGTVGSTRERHDAAEVAAGVFGVVGIDNRLTIR